MKRFNYTFVLLALLASVLSFSSCSKPGNSPEPSGNLSGKWEVISINPASLAINIVEKDIITFEGDKYTIASPDGTTKESGSYSLKDKSLQYQGSAIFPKTCKIIGSIESKVKFTGDINIADGKPAQPVTIVMKKI